VHGVTTVIIVTLLLDINAKNVKIVQLVKLEQIVINLPVQLAQIVRQIPIVYLIHGQMIVYLVGPVQLVKEDLVVG
jgi:hypothetical protein